jgi:glucans biosynthesis protein C
VADVSREVESDRLVYVDWLRFLAVLGLVAIHASQVFNPWDEWHITNRERDPILGELAVLTAPWIMPLLMLLSGITAWHSLLHRTNTQFARERVKHLLVPLLLGTVLLVQPEVWLERRFRGQFNGSFLQWMPHSLDGGVYPKGNASWHHLWFLAHLFAYSLITLPLFRHWQSSAGQRQFDVVARFCSSPGAILGLALPLVAERHLLATIFPERHMLTVDWSNHALMLVAYVYGFVLGGDPRLGVAIDHQWLGALAAALFSVLLLALGTWHGLIPARIPPPYTMDYLAFWTVYGLAAWTCMVTFLGAGRRWLRQENPVLDYGRSTSDAWYILHHGVILALAYFIVRWPVALPMKYLALLILGFAGTALGAELARRIPFLRRFIGFSATLRG